MKKIIIFIIMSLAIHTNVYATDNSYNTDILEEQVDNLDIYSIIEESNKYTEEVYEDLDMKEVLNSAISGEIDNNLILKAIVKLFGEEVRNSINLIGSILVIIIIHAIIRAMTDGLENKGIGQITYYVQYILIITITMTNFMQIVNSVKDSINNLLVFINSIIPILMSLMLATGSVTSVSMIQPILLFLITFIGNLINTLIIPILLIGTTLGIISKISSKVQVDKLAKVMKSGTVWILGFVLTLFVGILSLEGNLTAGVDGITAKTAKVAVSSFVPVVGKILRRCSRYSNWM